MFRFVLTEPDVLVVVADQFTIHESASVELHVKALEPPALMLLGVAVKVAVGIGAVPIAFT